MPLYHHNDAENCYRVDTSNHRTRQHDNDTPSKEMSKHMIATLKRVTVAFSIAFLLQSAAACEPPPPSVCDSQCAIRLTWPDNVEGWALAVARCESTLKPNARNGSHVGLFQLTGKYHKPRASKLGFTWEQVSTEAWANAATAYDLYAEQGRTPWAASKHCWG